MIGLRFLLNYGAFLAVMMPREDAKRIVNDWISGKLTGRIIGSDGGVAGGPWAIDAKSIMAVHALDPTEMTTLGAQSSPGAFPTSGIGKKW
ncbi:MAG: hypothetical protein KGL39_00045 [Patescibacteria group bacterium]|nr:hypothetical protein [Patescibacteria group bacterium]